MSRSFFKSLSILLVLFLLTIGVSAIAQVQNPDTVTVAGIGQITSIDPAYPNWSSNANTFYWAVYDSLIRYKRDSLTEYEPMLATKVPTEENGLIVVNEDGSTDITFPIREGVKFHKGGEMTPEDVKYTLMRKLTLEPVGGESGAVLRALTGYNSLTDWAKDLESGLEGFDEASQETVNEMYEVLDKSIEVDGNEVTFHLVQPVGLFLAYLVKGNNGTGCITDKEWVIEQGGWPGTPETWQDYYSPKEEETALFDKANGTGPFMIDRWDIASQEMVMEAFDGYWKGPADYETLVLKYVEEWSTRKLMLQKGDADFVHVPVQFLPQVEKMDGVTIEPPQPDGVVRAYFYQWPIKGTRFTGSGKLDGNGIPPDFFADVHVRKAFNYLFPYEKFIDQVLDGVGWKLHGPISKLLPGYSDDNPTYSYNREKAIEHLKKAHDGKVWEKGFKFTAVNISGSEMNRYAFEMLREELRSIKPKFQFDLHHATWNEFIPLRTSMQIPFFISGWGLEYGDAMCFLPQYLASDGYFNPYIPGLAELGKKHADPLLEEARQTFDIDKRVEIYKELLEYSYDYATHLWGVEQAAQIVHRSWIDGYYFHPTIPGFNLPGIPFYSISKG